MYDEDSLILSLPERMLRRRCIAALQTSVDQELEIVLSTASDLLIAAEESQLRMDLARSFAVLPASRVAIRCFGLSVRLHAHGNCPTELTRTAVSAAESAFRARFTEPRCHVVPVDEAAGLDRWNALAAERDAAHSLAVQFLPFFMRKQASILEVRSMLGRRWNEASTIRREGIVVDIPAATVIDHRSKEAA